MSMLVSMTDSIFRAEAATETLLRLPPREAVEWVRRSVDRGGRVLSIEPLAGGMSHGNHLIRVETAHSTHEVVLRRWVRPDWRETDPEFSPAQEAAAYGLLASSAVSAPCLLATDTEPIECDVPAILLTRMPGTRPTKPANMSSFLAQLAAALQLVHEISPRLASLTLPPYRPYYVRDQLRAPAWTRWPSAWECAIEMATGPEPAEPAVFIHRDYHPGNTLWADDELTAIVDWTTASWGSRSVDLAHMRANLAMSFGVEAADGFLSAYRSVVGLPADLDPYWDLRVAVDFLPELRSEISPQLARLDDFVARAVAALL
jgi:aminoglycoside phosphotransferase (APT) family kinase protein